MNIRTLHYVVLLLIILATSCQKQTDYLEEALQFAGTNRPELEKVLAHYSVHPADSLKYRAAVFLIENMPYHYSYSDTQLLNQYYDRVDSAIQSCRNDETQDVKIVLKDLFAESPFSRLKTVSDVKIITSQYLIDNIDASFYLWLNGEWAVHIGFDDFCEYLLPYKIAEYQILDEWKTYLKPEFSGDLNTLHYCDLYRNLAWKACETVNQKLKDQLNPQIVPNGENMISIGRLSTLIRMPMGVCEDYCIIASSVMRSKGIPAGTDFTPQWPFRSMGHSWNILLDNMGKNVIFEGGGPVPGSPHKKEHKMAKVFRRTYAINREWETLMQTEKHLPATFQKNRFFKDVTDEYMETQDVEISIPKEWKNRHRYAYLALFDNKNWVPVHYGKVSGDRVKFDKMGKMSMYLPVFYDEQGVRPFAEPFYIDYGGQVRRFEADTAHRQTVDVRRKYFIGSHCYGVGVRLPGGKFQAANRPDFSDAVTLYTIPGFTVQSGEVFLDTLQTPYRYWRYYSADERHNNLAELYFYGEGSEQPVYGKITGTNDSYNHQKGNEKEAVFDGNPLSYYDALTPSHSWVGMDFGGPVKIRKISYTPRSDGNDVTPGDIHELLYWDNHRWNSTGKRQATDIKLVYENLPSGTIYWIRNLSRGRDERIFSYENEKQIFW
ncbi:hypothetical protein AGMMS50239_24890 [Bacteroidia bacterium]|nr:hypothetical protein AGMMS50239_24890 [Bacteroidia bacterium]